MAKIAKNLNELIGNTPLLQLSNFASNKNLEANVIVKLESFNPAGCVKERIALAMIEAAEAAGILKPGVEIIEPTSGNTGIGLAMVAAVKGYKLTLTMPETMSIERRNLLKAFGANLVLTPGANGMKGAIARAIELHEENPASFIPQQFENAANPEVHYRTTTAPRYGTTPMAKSIFL
jgi:cysteine synthase A